VLCDDNAHCNNFFSSCPIATIFDSSYPPHCCLANRLLKRLRRADLVTSNLNCEIRNIRASDSVSIFQSMAFQLGDTRPEPICESPLEMIGTPKGKKRKTSGTRSMERFVEEAMRPAETSNEIPFSVTDS